MTDRHEQLDLLALRLQEPLTLYRLARARYANLSGAGAAVEAGRWNRPSQEAIYTSIEQGVPLLERLVHTPKEQIPSNLAMMRLRISGQWHLTPTHHDASIALDASTGGSMLLCQSLARAEVLWQVGHFFDTVLALAVPSVIVPVWNLVLYPQSPAFWSHVTFESAVPFDLDPRLFADHAVVEPSS